MYTQIDPTEVAPHVVTHLREATEQHAEPFYTSMRAIQAVCNDGGVYAAIIEKCVELLMIVSGEYALNSHDHFIVGLLLAEYDRIDLETYEISRAARCHYA